jgi:hypothetical protein
MKLQSQTGGLGAAAPSSRYQAFLYEARGVLFYE